MIPKLWAMIVRKMRKGNPARALLYPAALAAVVQTKGSPVASTQATAPQRYLTVQTNLVLVPVFVYDPARMAQAPKQQIGNFEAAAWRTVVREEARPGERQTSP